MIRDDKHDVSFNAVLWFAQALLEDGWMADVRLSIRDGVVARIDAGVPRRPEDEAHSMGLPGLANVHSHAFQRGMAGLVESRGPTSDDFWTWREVMYRFLDRGGPDEIEAITAFAFMEMLEGGFTRVAEFHYLHNDPAGAPYADPAEITGRIVAAAGETGIGLTLLPVFYAHSSFGGERPTTGQRRFVTSLDGFSDLVEAGRRLTAPLPDPVMGIAPHSLRAVTPEELAKLIPLAGDGPIHIHVAEQTKEVADSLAWCGARPVEWLLANAPVDRRWCLIHATHVLPEEVRGMAKSGAVAGLCPITEANLGDGIFPAPDFLRAGGRFGVGTDSNVLIGVAEELRMMEYAQRLALRSRNVLARAEGSSTGADLYAGALGGGAQAVGAGGALRQGASADIVALDGGHPAFISRKPEAFLDSWIFSGERRLVNAVWRRGRRVVSDGQHAQRAQITQRYRRALETILA